MLRCHRFRAQVQSFRLLIQQAPWQWVMACLGSSVTLRMIPGRVVANAKRSFLLDHDWDQALSRLAPTTKL